MNTLDLVHMQKINGGCNRCERLMRRYERLKAKGKDTRALRVRIKISEIQSCQC